MIHKKPEIKDATAISDSDLLEKLRSEIEPLVRKSDRLLDCPNGDFEKTIGELKNIQKKWIETVNRIEIEKRIRLSKKDEDYYIPINPDELFTFHPVEMVDVEQPYEWLPKNQFPKTNAISKDNIESGIANKFLYLQIDLTCDKKELNKHFDDAISIAQKAVGKNKEHETTVILQNYFNNLFEKYYIKEKLSKAKSLEKISTDFENKRHPLESDTLSKTYFQRYKKEKGVNDIRDLRKG